MKEMIEMAKSENSALVINNSWGLSKKIIDTIKGGTLLYIHGDDKTYASRSTFIRQDEMQENREDI